MTKAVSISTTTTSTSFQNHVYNIYEPTHVKKAGPAHVGQSDAQCDWYSGGRGFDPQSGHISFIEIWL